MLRLQSHSAVVSCSPECSANAVNTLMIMLIFFYYLFSFVFIADSRIFSVGDTLWVCRRGSLRALERRQRRRGFRSGLKPSQFCLQHLCGEQTECAPQLA